MSKSLSPVMSIFADLSEQGKTLLICSHECGEAQQAMMIMDNIQQAYWCQYSGSA